MAGKLIKRNGKWSFKYYDTGKEKRYTCDSTTFESAKEEQMHFLLSSKSSGSDKTLCKPFLKEYLEASKRDKALRTYLSEKQALNHFFNFLYANYENIKYLDEITLEILEDYKGGEKNRGQSTNSINSKIIKLKAFFNYIFKRKKIKENPAAGLKYIKKGRRIPRFLSVDEVEKLKNADTRRDIYYLANLISLYTGFRPDEVYWLTKRDINFKTMGLSITPKEGWEPKDYEARTNPISDKLLAVLQEICALNPKSDFLMTDYTGHRPTYHNFTKSTAKVFRRREIGIKNATMYTLRHTYASHLSMNGVALNAIQKLLGHADIETTMIYANVSPAYIDHNTVSKLPF
jgi:site-specific recombinase XerD